MKNLMLLFVVILLAASSLTLYFVGADGRYVKKAMDDFPAWEAARLDACAIDLKGNNEECRCLLDNVMQYNPGANRPPSDASIWDSAYIRSVFYSENQSQSIFGQTINAAIEKEVGKNSLKSQKALDIRDRYFDAVAQAVTFQCFKGDKVFAFMDDPRMWRQLKKMTKGANLVGRARNR